MKNLESHFNFNTVPFTRELDINKRFLLPLYDESVKSLVDTVKQRMSGAIIGPAGVGKTFLLRAIREELPDARYHVSYIKVTGLSVWNMCKEVACAIGCKPAGSYAMLIRRLQEKFLSNMDVDSTRPVLLIDEANDLRPEVLRMLRVLTNFDMDSRLIVSIILSGQQGLKALLRRDDMEDIARRLSHYAVLRTLSREEIKQYIEHRVTVAGASTIPFDSSSIE
ncbi:AAA family ATPase, partial [bacterium]|nr:AAA family ATPase [bacterium]